MKKYRLKVNISNSPSVYETIDNRIIYADDLYHALIYYRNIISYKYDINISDESLRRRKRINFSNNSKFFSVKGEMYLDEKLIEVTIYFEYETLNINYVPLYKLFSDKVSFNTIFKKYIIAFCPDTAEWFITNKRFFFYEFPAEFETRKEAEEFLIANVNYFTLIEKDLMNYKEVQNSIKFLESENNQKFINVKVKKKDNSNIIRCKRKSIEIKAIQWNGTNYSEMDEFSGNCTIEQDDSKNVLFIHNMDNVIIIMLGDYLIKNEKGNFHRCSVHEFNKIYEKI